MSRPEDSYTRRIAAVLVADVSGFSALMGEDDERTARDVRHVRTLVQAIVTDLQGSAVPQAGDAIFASFESVVSAVEAALRVQKQLADEERPDRPLRLRIGVHFGDVLLMDEGGALGDAINVAARLCALARPGTVCISEGVYRHVRTRFEEAVEDLGRQRLKNISGPVHAYLIVPRSAGPARRHRAAVPLWALGAAAAAVLAMGAGFWMTRPTTPPATGMRAIVPDVAPPAAKSPASGTQQVTLGVMLFKPLREDPEHGWMREALRDGLNTQLSGLSKVKVYSKEFLDLLISKEGLSEIEAANKLGISKMLSGSFVAVGDALRIETHVVDVATGVLETSSSTTGRVGDFLALQTRMTEDVIARLDIPITPEERKTLLAQQNTSVDALRMLLEAEGNGAGTSGGTLKPDSPPPPGSSLWRWLARVVEPAPAYADDRADIAALLEQYRKATEAGEATALAATYVEFTPEQQAAQQRYFDNAKDLKVTIEDVDSVIVGGEAVVSYTRTDDFADARTGHPMHVQVRLTKKLQHTAEGWRLAAGK